MTEVIILIIKISGIAIFPVLLMVSFYKNINVLSTLMAFMFLGFLGMIALSFSH